MKKIAFTLMMIPSLAFAGSPALTRETGAPVGDNNNSKTAGPRGGVLLEDVHLLEKLARFDRERIPERVVHARGAGAHGAFVSAGDFGWLTKASLFAQKGKKTPVFVRFSSVIHSKGSPENLRDPRGFATKFYTDQGNWDLVGNNLPVFFIRDAMKFPDMVHSLKPDPVSNAQDPNRFFDFFAHVPESTHMLTLLYSDLGTPASYRKMDGNGVHAYKFVNAKGQVRYAKFRWKSQQGVANLSAKQASSVQDFAYLTRDLYGAISGGDHPRWKLVALVMEPQSLSKQAFNPLDATKDWRCEMRSVRCVTLGEMTLDRVPSSFFAESEQSAFSPAVIVPGIEPSEDRLLQGRLFSYSDTQRYRLGVNYQYLPINRAKSPVRTHNQDGALAFLPQEGSVNYQPNNFSPQAQGSRSGGMYRESAAARYSSARLDGATQQRMIAKTLNFAQAGEAYRRMSSSQKRALISNFAGDLNQVRAVATKVQIVAHTYAADAEYGKRLAERVGVKLRAVRKVAAQLLDADRKLALR